jgi:hypothetical protein
MCGKPVGQTQSGSGPAQPNGPQGKPLPDKKSLLVIGVIVICVILAAIFFTGILPVKTGASPVPVTAQPITTTPAVYTIVSTPQPTSVPVTNPTPVIVQSERFGSKYEQVFGINQNFSYGQKEIFSHNLRNPPLYIRFNVTPVTINRHIMVSIGTSEEHMVNTTVVSPNAWFEVEVYDIDDGKIVDEEGFGKDYSDMTEREFMVRQPGNYRIEMSGHEVSANVSILTGLR